MVTLSIKQKPHDQLTLERYLYMWVEVSERCKYTHTHTHTHTHTMCSLP